MDDQSLIRINDDLWIPRTEIAYRATRSGGPGGQHANTSSTRVELEWDVGASPSVTEAQRSRIRNRLSNRISQEGLLQLSSASSRSQHQNKEEVTDRFAELLREALHVPKRRKRTRPPRASREKRLRAKKRRAEIKRLRGPVKPE